MKKGSEDHLHYLTLTVALDYMRDAEELWKQSHDAWINADTKWIFDPNKIENNGSESLIDLFKKIKDRRPTKDAGIWCTICKTLLNYNGNVLNFLEHFDFDAVSISDYLHKKKKDFPYLRGYKIKPLWLRIVNDTAGIKLKRIKEIPIPIDVHTARMTLKIIFNETFDGKITKQLRERTQNAWKIILNGNKVYPLQIDEPLWRLGKYDLLDDFMNGHNFKL